jgi:hypothetical protein
MQTIVFAGQDDTMTMREMIIQLVVTTVNLWQETHGEHYRRRTVPTTQVKQLICRPMAHLAVLSAERIFPVYSLMLCSALIPCVR